MSTAAWTPVDETAAKWTPVAESSPAAAQKGILDREIPLTSYGNATLSGVQSIGRGLRDAIKGTWDTLATPPQDNNEKAAGLLGPPGLALYRTLRGLGHTAEDATQLVGAIHDINKSPDPAGTYLKAAGETAGQGAGQALTAVATEGIGKGISAAKNAIPTTSRAGAALEDIKSTVGDVPINTAKVGDSALELYTQSQRGATLPPAVNKLVRRLTQPDGEPMTYAEAKDFQSNISNLSANEKMNLKPNQVRLVGQLNADLKSSLEDVADTVGKGQQFTQAMKEYHNAMKLRGYSDAAIDAAWKAAVGAAGVYSAAKIFGMAHAPGQ